MGSLFEELKRRKVFKVAAAYAVVAFVLAQVAELVLPTFNAPDWVLQSIIFLFVLGLPLAIILAWAFDITPDGIKADSRAGPSQVAANNTDRKLIYAILLLVLVVAGFQFSDRFLSDNTSLANRSAIELGESQSGPVTRTAINLGLNSRSTNTRLRTEIAISPDGSKLVYTAFREGKIQLYLRELSELEPRVLAEVDNSFIGIFPSFSSDGDWLLYNNGRNLIRTRIVNGVPQVVDDDVGGMGVFSDSDQNVLFVAPPGILSRKPATGGTREPLGLANSEAEFFMWPRALPGGAVLFTASPRSGVINGAQVHLLDPQTGNTRLLIQDGYNARYAASGHIVYIYQGGIWAIPFDIDELAVTGAPAPIVREVETYSFTGSSVYSFSDAGRLVYLPGIDTFQGQQRRFVWVDKQGNEEPLGLEPQTYWYPSVAPNGEKLAFMIRQADNTRDIWTYEFSNNAFNRLTFTGTARYPVWSPDGESLAYSSNFQNISLIEVDGTGLPVVVSAENSDRPWSFTPDGNQLIGWSNAAGMINAYSLSDQPNSQTLIEGDRTLRGGRVSPNGRWIAYNSRESGIAEIYVRPFPNVDDGKWQVSVNGGQEAIWGPQGQELYYRRASDNAMLAVTVETATGFSTGNPRVLFTGDYFFGATPSYDLHPDGLRFLMLKTEDVATSSLPAEFTSLVVVENWFEELKRLAPPDPQ